MVVQVTPVLCDSVAKWQEVVPVAGALRNPHLQDRHWTKLQQELQIMLPVGPAFTVQTLFDLKVRYSLLYGLAASEVGSYNSTMLIVAAAIASVCT